MLLYCKITNSKNNFEGVQIAKILTRYRKFELAISNIYNFPDKML